MTEQEYIYVRDLSNVLAADRLLRDLNPGHSAMSDKELAVVLKTLLKWREELFRKINTAREDSDSSPA